jgi:hypothetical protein
MGSRVSPDLLAMTIKVVFQSMEEKRGMSTAGSTVSITRNSTVDGLSNTS